MIFSLLILLCMDVDFQLEDAFGPVDLGQVAVSKNNEIFFLSRREKKVSRYDSSGKLLGRFSGPGEGPAELEAPLHIFLDAGHCYITDWNKGVITFDLEGQFLSASRSSDAQVEPIKAGDGWFYARTRPSDQQMELVFCDGQLKNPTVLASFPAATRQIFIKVPDGTTAQVSYSPAAEAPVWDIDPERALMYLFLPKANDLQVIDLHTHQIVKRIPIPLKRQPFNTAWAEKQIETLKARIHVGGKKVPVMVDAVLPTTFPLVRDVILGPEQNIWLLEGPTVMDHYDSTLILDREGKVLETQVSSALVTRVRPFDKTRSLVLVYDQEQEQASIKICETTKVKQVLTSTTNEPAEQDPPPINIPAM